MSIVQSTRTKVTNQLREEFSEELSELGRSTCPCCKHKSQVYRRTITVSMLKALRILAERQREWFHMEAVLKNHTGISSATRGDAAKLRHWGLLEQDDERLGYYRVTEQALAFLRGDLVQPRAVYIYRGTVVSLHPTEWVIKDFENNHATPKFTRDADDATKDSSFLGTLKKSLRTLFKKS
jgi:hypothetical protein